MRDLTFFVWSDTHFGYQQRFAGEDQRWQVVEQMNRLPGWPYPAEIGGCVDEPAFVMHCGDLVDANAEPERALHFYRYFRQHLVWEQRETLGNHDGSEAVQAEFVARHGSRSYSFMSHGVHCLSIDMEYDAAETGSVSGATLDFLRDDLAGVVADTPVILFSHASLSRITNTPDVLGAIGKGKVVLAVAGHHHRPAVYRLGNMPCVDVGQCRDHPADPEYGRSLAVIRVRGNEILALPWRWDLRDWEHGQRWGRDGEGAPPSVVERFLLRSIFGPASG